MEKKNLSKQDKTEIAFPVTFDHGFQSSANSSTNNLNSDDKFKSITKDRLVSVMLHKTVRLTGTKRKSPDDTGDDCDNDSADNSPQHVAQHLPQSKADGSPESIRAWSLDRFRTDESDDKEQQAAFEILASKFVLSCIHEAEAKDLRDLIDRTDQVEYNRCKKLLEAMVRLKTKDKQLIMFLTGPGGSGKSEVIKTLLEYAQEYCSMIKCQFTEYTILVTAYSGVAATLIHGQTLHSATQLAKKQKNVDDTLKTAWKNHVRMLIVDEISLMKPSEMKDLSARMNYLLDTPGARYGNVDVAFMGDFRQLLPIGPKPIYENMPLEFRTYVNCYIELKGQYRFREDPLYGEMCWRFNRGVPTAEDFELINGRMVHDTINPLPFNTRVCCKINKERDAVNAGTWLQHLNLYGAEQGFIILSDKVQIRESGKPVKPLRDYKTYYTEVGEADCDTHMEGRFAPMLLLYPNCPMMMTTNKSVANNEANGTQGVCKGIKLNGGCSYHMRDVNGLRVKCAYASQVKHLLWEVDNVVKEIKPCEFTSIVAKFPFYDEGFDAGMKNPPKISIYLNATQIPLVSNNATTGHKLQGSTVKSLYIPSWSYTTNWPYVAISRVKTLSGLFIGRELDPSADYSVPQSLLKMEAMFRRHNSPQHFDYDKLDMDSYFEKLKKAQAPKPKTTATPMTL